MDPTTTTNASLPSFVELMASLGLTDEHSAHALLRGAAADEPLYSTNLKDKEEEANIDDKHNDKDVEDSSHSYRNSTASAASLELLLLPLHALPTPTLLESSTTTTMSMTTSTGTPNSITSMGVTTPLSSASLLTPLNSPPVQRDHHRDRERPASHGHVVKKRYSPYGLISGPAIEHRDVCSVPSPILATKLTSHRSIQDVVPLLARSANYKTWINDSYTINQLQQAIMEMLTFMSIINVSTRTKMGMKRCATQPLRQ